MAKPAEIPINEYTTRVDNHDIPSADIMMENASLTSGFVGYNVG